MTTPQKKQPPKPTPAEIAAHNHAAALRDSLVTARRRQAIGPYGPSSSMMCRADSWTAHTNFLDGDYALDDPFGRALITRLIQQQPAVGDQLRAWEPKAFVSQVPHPAAAPAKGGHAASPTDWLSDYLTGDYGGKGMGSEMFASTLAPASALSFTTGGADALQHVARAATSRSTVAKLTEGAEKVAAGAKRVVINEFMELYNANTGKGRPRIRLRIRGMKVTMLEPIAAEDAWRAGQKGAVMSARWAGIEARAAAVGGVAARARWGAGLGKLAWTTTKVGGGVLAFAPTAAIDAYKDLHYSVDSHGRRQLTGVHNFLVHEAANQSGNAVGFGTTIAVGIAAGALGVTAVAGAPIVLVAFGAGLVAMTVFNYFGVNTKIGDATDHFLKSHGH